MRDRCVNQPDRISPAVADLRRRPDAEAGVASRVEMAVRITPLIPWDSSSGSNANSRIAARVTCSTPMERGWVSSRLSGSTSTKAGGDGSDAAVVAREGVAPSPCATGRAKQLGTAFDTLHNRRRHQPLLPRKQLLDTLTHLRPTLLGQRELAPQIEQRDLSYLAADTAALYQKPPVITIMALHFGRTDMAVTEL